MRRLLLLVCLMPAAVQLASAQGVAVPNRPNRPQPKVKLNVPLPKVRFQDVAAQAGLTAPNVSGPARDKQYIIETIGSGVALLDYDNDGWKDILMVNGHVYPEVDSLKSNSPFKQERVLFWNLGDKTFYDVSETAGAILDRRASRGAAFGDLDNDGGIDVVVNNINGTPSLLRNSGERQNWTLLQLVGTKSNRSGIGARVTVFTAGAGGAKQMDEVRSGGSFLSQNDLRLHFGLGKATLIERAEVVWPSGRKEMFAALKANRVIVLEEGKGAAGKPAAGKRK